MSSVPATNAGSAAPDGAGYDEETLREVVRIAKDTMYISHGVEVFEQYEPSNKLSVSTDHLVILYLPDDDTERKPRRS
jgi:hypothetical protein